ncbi:hypothetical protein ACFYP4_04930 [Streptomyces sp. NPDC005551]|uniref:hypothetical protein n=1 Tax=unclassified Streptomyces TaxID=2593676 RepID=UPI0033E6D901
MSNAQMTEMATTDPRGSVTQSDQGHGRHRGPVSAQDDQAAPRGRHRRPSGQPDTAS